ncbi:MAG: T9SS type A sorting domain-containing protein [Runella sp.]
MKTQFALMVLTVGLGVATATIAQDTPKKETNQDRVTIRARITEDKNGKTETTERIYIYDNLLPQERETKIKSIVDSLRGEGQTATNRRMSIVVEEGQTSDKRDIITHRNGGNRVEIYQRGPGKTHIETWNDDHYETYRFDEEAMANRMKRIEKRIHPQMQKLERQMDELGRRIEPKVMHIWGETFGGSPTKPSTIRGLEAFPNNPDKQELNIKFYAPEKGDVVITVMDTKGKQITRKEVKNFSGDYVGQLSLGKDPKGTYFISVVQNEDGAVKRIVIP